MLMTDQDHDGSHIKGLIINFIHCYWPSLLQHHDFLREFVTPIVKVPPWPDPTVLSPPPATHCAILRHTKTRPIWFILIC